MKFALIGMLALLPSLALAQDPFASPAEIQQENDPDWAKADKAVTAYLGNFEEKMRAIELTSPRMEKYLPESRIFARIEPGSRGAISWLFAVNREGAITDFGMVNRLEYLKPESTSGMKLEAFIRAQKIPLKNEQAAVSLVYFYEELIEGAEKIASLKINAKEDPVFEKGIMEVKHSRHEDKDWKYSCEKYAGGWQVQIDYVGDPATSIMAPQNYQVDTDEQGDFLGIWEKNLPGGAGRHADPNDPFGF